MTADLLRDAAKVLREHVALFGGRNDPWVAGESNAPPYCQHLAFDGDPQWSGIADVLWPDAGDYLRLMHPPVALALAAVLEAGAEAEDEMDAFDDLNDDSASLVVRGAAIKLARAILRRSE